MLDIGSLWFIISETSWLTDPLGLVWENHLKTHKFKTWNTFLLHLTSGVSPHPWTWRDVAGKIPFWWFSLFTFRNVYKSQCTILNCVKFVEWPFKPYSNIYKNQLLSNACHARLSSFQARSPTADLCSSPRPLFPCAPVVCLSRSPSLYNIMFRDGPAPYELKMTASPHWRVLTHWHVPQTFTKTL